LKTDTKLQLERRAWKCNDSVQDPGRSSQVCFHMYRT